MDIVNEENVVIRTIKAADASFESFMGAEKNPEVERIYKYPETGDPVLWVEKVTKEKPFEPIYYSMNSSTNPETVVEIPPSNTRSYIHFLPPEAHEAYKRAKFEDMPWHEDEKFQSQRITIVKKYIECFVDLLKAIKSGKLEVVDYIAGFTNSTMASAALALGFRRRWENSPTPPGNISLPMTDPDREYKIGISVAELKILYDLETLIPTVELVNKKVRKYTKTRRAKEKVLEPAY